MLKRQAMAVFGVLALHGQAGAGPLSSPSDEEARTAPLISTSNARRTGLRALPRPVAGQEGPVLTRLAEAKTPDTAQRAPSSPPARTTAVRALPRADGDGSVLGARLEWRAGWDSARLGGGESDLSADGASYGVSAGYDRAVGEIGPGHVFIGGFASIDMSTGAATARLSDSFTDGSGRQTDIDFSTGIEAGRDLELGLRAGWTTERFALYALAALTNAKRLAQTSVTTTRTDQEGNQEVTGPETSPEAEFFQDGWRLGAGAEMQIQDSVYAKTEYRYSVYDEDDTRHQILTGLGLRF